MSTEKNGGSAGAIAGALRRPRKIVDAILKMPMRLGRSPSPVPVYHLQKLAGVMALLLFACVVALAQAPNLKPSGYINDYVGVLSAPAKQRLEDLATELKQKTGAEVAVAIVRSLNGEPVENYANLLAEKWSIGDQEDRGALLLLATDDRALRLEVGYGLEPIIPDGRAGAILDEVTPHLRAGDYDGAVAAGVWGVAQIVAQDRGVTLSGQAPPPQTTQRRGRRGSWWPLLFILPFLLSPRRRRSGGWHSNAVTTAWLLGSLGGIGRHGGSGRGMGGGGGFGGFGGGGFGGGGASRSW
jgi:uncharacterized protein